MQNEQRAKLQSQIWKIANEVRGFFLVPSEHFSRCVNLEEIDINKLNEEIEKIVENEEILRNKINNVIINLKA